jgi:hypothetical protein
MGELVTEYGDEVQEHAHLIDWSHTHSVPNHTHDLEFGIYEYENLPTSVQVKVDGNIIPGLTSLSVNNYNIVPYLNKDASGKITRVWHKVEVIPNDLARVTATVVKQIFIQSRGGDNY